MISRNTYHGKFPAAICARAYRQPAHLLQPVQVDVSPPDAENKILVDVYSHSSPDQICTQVIAPFDVNIPLGSFPAGKYLLWVNGEMLAEFQS
ncbi:MAG: hypothetical protein IPN58_00840 [Anaerolineales bacterium]|nr:hypothetical protein [Anaerolineales bacterium]